MADRCVADQDIDRRKRADISPDNQSVAFMAKSFGVIADVAVENGAAALRNKTVVYESTARR